MDEFFELLAEALGVVLIMFFALLLLGTLIAGTAWIVWQVMS